MSKNSFTRSAELDRGGLDTGARILRCSFSSEEPYERSFGTEILDHNPASVDLSRLKTGAPLLWNHERNEQIGVVESCDIEGGKLVASVRFSKNGETGKRIFSDIEDGIIRNVSIGYQIKKMVEEKALTGGMVYRATGWTPLELSIVSVPADASVGIGRSAELPEGVQVDRIANNMEPAQKDGADSPAVKTILIIK